MDKTNDISKTTETIKSLSQNLINMCLIRVAFDNGTDSDEFKMTNRVWYRILTNDAWEGYSQSDCIASKHESV